MQICVSSHYQAKMESNPSHPPFFSHNCSRLPLGFDLVHRGPIVGRNGQRSGPGKITFATALHHAFTNSPWNHPQNPMIVTFFYTFPKSRLFKQRQYIHTIIYIYTRIYMYSENCSTRILNLEADQVFSKDPLGPPKLWPTMQHVGSISGLPVFQGSLRTYKIAVDRKPTKISCRMR